MVLRASDLSPAARQLLGLGEAPRRHKYGAKRTRLDGHKFDSKLEAKRYAELKLLERAGKISDLKVHPALEIIINGVLVCTVEMDFKYFGERVGGPRGRQYPVVEDAKGEDNAMSRLKRKLLKAVHGIDTVVVR